MRIAVGRMFALGLVVLAASCAARVPTQTQPKIFFPPAPALPRIQYLTSFAGRKDIEVQSSFNKFVAGEKEDLKLNKPYGIAIRDGKVYVCDTNATVLVFDFKTKSLAPLKGATGNGKLVQPINISIDADGNAYVADPVRGQVVVFDRNDEYLKAYGTPGDWRPVDAVAFEDRVYVVDTQAHLLKVFDKSSGEFVKNIGDKGEDSEHLERPTNVLVDGEGSLYVTDIGRFQVVKFDRDGHFKSTFGKPGDNLGHFARPKGTAVDREGRLYAVDASFNNAQVFNKEGRLLLFFGSTDENATGEEPGELLLPAKVTIDYDNVALFQDYVAPDFEVDYLVFVTSQFGPHLVNVFAYGKRKGEVYPTDEELLRLVDERRKKELEKQAKP